MHSKQIVAQWDCDRRSREKSIFEYRTRPIGVLLMNFQHQTHSAPAKGRATKRCVDRPYFCLPPLPYHRRGLRVSTLLSSDDWKGYANAQRSWCEPE